MLINSKTAIQHFLFPCCKLCSLSKTCSNRVNFLLMSALNILKLGFVCRGRESLIYHIDLRPAAPRWCKWAAKRILWGKHAREHPQLSIHNSFSLYHPTALWLIMIPWTYLKSSQLASLYDSTHVSQQLITAERGGIARTHICTRPCVRTHIRHLRGHASSVKSYRRTH